MSTVRNIFLSWLLDFFFLSRLIASLKMVLGFSVSHDGFSCQNIEKSLNFLSSFCQTFWDINALKYFIFSSFRVVHFEQYSLSLSAKIRYHPKTGLREQQQMMLLDQKKLWVKNTFLFCRESKELQHIFSD